MLFVDKYDVWNLVESSTPARPLDGSALRSLSFWIIASVRCDYHMSFPPEYPNLKLAKLNRTYRYPFRSFDQTRVSQVERQT